MSYLFWLVPIALGMGLVGLGAFMWSLRTGQYEDLDGAAERVLISDAADAPLRQHEFKGSGVPPKRGNAAWVSSISSGNTTGESDDAPRR